MYRLMFQSNHLLHHHLLINPDIIGFVFLAYCILLVIHLLAPLLSLVTYPISTYRKLILVNNLCTKMHPFYCVSYLQHYIILNLIPTSSIPRFSMIDLFVLILLSKASLLSLLAFLLKLGVSLILNMLSLLFLVFLGLGV